MNNSFFSILQRLKRENVEFVLIGGFAAAVYGCTLFTQDIDICCDFSQDNLLRLQKALKDINPVHRMTPNRIKLELTAENISHLKNLYLSTDLGLLDCLSVIEGLGDFNQASNASRLIESEGMKLHILTIDALIKAKEAMNRPRDQQAVVQLKAIKEITKNNNI